MWFVTYFRVSILFICYVVYKLLQSVFIFIHYLVCHLFSVLEYYSPRNFKLNISIFEEFKDVTFIIWVFCDWL